MYYATLHIGTYCRVCANVYICDILSLSLSLSLLIQNSHYLYVYFLFLAKLL